MNKKKEYLFAAIRFGKEKDFYSLLNNVDINCINTEKMSLLQIATIHNRLVFCEKLLERGVNIHNVDERGQNVLHTIAQSDNYGFAKKLIDSGSNLVLEDNYGNQPLWTAVVNARGNYELVKLFLEYGSDPNHKNKNNKSPLDFAKQLGDKQLIRLLNKNNPRI